MLKLAADENFNNAIVRGVVRLVPEIDFVRVQDAGLSGADDPTVLEWAAREGRALFTHDTATMGWFAYDRVAQGLPMPGVFTVDPAVPVRLVIEEIIIIAECSFEGEWENQVPFLPLR